LKNIIYKMKQLSLLILLIVLTTTSYSQTSSKTENIKKLLELTGAKKLGVQVAQTLVNSFKESGTTAPDDFWNEFLKEMDSDTLIKMTVPIYEKYYSDKEIMQLIDFYKSEIGKKVVQVTPMIMQESMQLGKIWGKDIAEKLQSRLREKGYLKQM